MTEQVSNRMRPADGGMTETQRDMERYGVTNALNPYIFEIINNVKKGPEGIKKLQIFLSDANDQNIPIDGKYGPQTKQQLEFYLKRYFTYDLGDFTDPAEIPEHVQNMLDEVEKNVSADPSNTTQDKVFNSIKGY